MARLLFPDEASRLVYRVVTGSKLEAAVGATAVFYSDVAASILADIRTYDGSQTPGAAIPGSTLIVDGNSLIPLFWGPDEIDTLYVKVNLGPTTAIYARADARFDSISNPRVTTIVSSATPTINTDIADAVSITELAVNITSFTTNLTGSPVNFAKLVFRIKDNGTARTLAWGAKFSTGLVSLPSTTVLGQTMMVGFFYNSVTAVWECMAAGSVA